MTKQERVAPGGRTQSQTPALIYDSTYLSGDFLSPCLQTMAREKRNVQVRLSIFLKSFYNWMRLRLLLIYLVGHPTVVFVSHWWAEVAAVKL